MLLFSYYYSLTLLFLFSLMSHRYYSATILQMSGVRDDRLAIWLAGLTTLTNFLFTLLGVWLVERVGRRKLTLGSIIGKAKGGGDLSCPNQQKILKVVFVRSLRYLIIIFFDRHMFQFESVGHRFLNVCTAQSPCHLPPIRPRHGQLYLLQVPVSTLSTGLWRFRCILQYVVLLHQQNLSVLSYLSLLQQQVVFSFLQLF